MTAKDREHVEEIINHLKRVENDYGIDLTEEMRWLRGLNGYKEYLCTESVGTFEKGKTYKAHPNSPVAKMKNNFVTVDEEPVSEVEAEKKGERSIPDIVDEHFYEMLTNETEWFSKTVESKSYKLTARYFAEWGKRYIGPVSEDLEKTATQYGIDNFPSLCNGCKHVPVDAFKAGAKWQEEKEYTCYEEAFEDGAKWKKEQFEKNRLKHCDVLTEEQAQMESDFVVQHLKKNNRTPTFIDAIEYGMRLQKEQMMTKAIDAHCFGFQGAALFSFRLPADKYLVGSEVKVVVIKEE